MAAFPLHVGRESHSKTYEAEHDSRLRWMAAAIPSETIML
jgi:hypothetical protein